MTNLKQSKFCQSTIIPWVFFAFMIVVHFSFVNSCKAQSVLPPPPKIGTTVNVAEDPVGYLVGGIKYFIFLGLAIIVVVALLAFSGGLISEVNEARRKGEWGRFAVFFGAGLVVVFVVILGAWWGSTRLMTI